MVSRPDFPPPPRRRPPPFPATAAPARKADVRTFEPARYVHGMLMAQGVVWLVLAAAGLAAWIVAFPADLNLISAGGAVLWAGTELLGIILAVCIGATEVGMACRMLGGRPRLLLASAIGLQGLMLALALILAAFLVTIGGSVLELLAVGALAGASFLGPDIRHNVERKRTDSTLSLHVSDVPLWRRLGRAGYVRYNPMLRLAGAGEPPRDDCKLAGVGGQHLDARPEMPGK